MQSIQLKLARLYSDKQADIPGLVNSIYEPDAVFDDPLIKVRGRDSISSQFQLLRRMLPSSNTSNGRWFVSDDGALLWECEFNVGLCGLVFGLESRLDVNSDSGRVTRHEDRWRFIAPSLFSAFYTLLRSSLGEALTALKSS
jgi:hypothetical protein